MSMQNKLQGKKVAILATNGFEQSELFEPRDALKDAGAEVYIISLEKGAIRGWNKTEWGDSVEVDFTLDEARADGYDALVLPGGLFNPDTLRQNTQAVDFVRAFFKEGYQKPVAAICHGPWLLIEANVVRGVNLTSYPSIKTDLINGGANWVDEEVVVDNGLVTSRSPKDLDAFIDKMLEEIVEGRHAA